MRVLLALKRYGFMERFSQGCECSLPALRIEIELVRLKTAQGNEIPNPLAMSSLFFLLYTSTDFPLSSPDTHIAKYLLGMTKLLFNTVAPDDIPTTLEKLSAWKEDLRWPP